tara:strand:+ start:1468 stop:2775 length:1308 start_codon:yes stop_codon:yes gene_type:complete
MKNIFKVIFIFLVFILFSCSEKKIEEDTVNQGFSILKYDAEISETITLNKADIKLGQAKEIYYWSKNSQNPQNNLGNILNNSGFNNKKKIVNGKKGPFSLVQPVFFENSLCHLISDGYIECIDTETNKTRFNVSIKPENIKNYEVIRGGISYFDEKLFFVDGYGQIISIDTNDGKIIWSKSISYPILSPPLIYRGYIYFVSADNRIFSVEINTGEIAWSFQTILETKKSIYTASPVAFENIIIAPFSNGELIAFKYDNGQPLWSDIASKVSIISNFDIKDISADPVISSNNLFSLSTNGKFLSINAITGKREWVIDISGRNTPIISGNQIYLLNNDSKLFCLNKNTGEVFWINQLDKFNGKNEDAKNLNLWLGPYLINDYLYLISYFGELIKIDPIDGNIIYSDSLNIKEIMIEPIILTDEIYFTDINSNVYRFK